MTGDGLLTVGGAITARPLVLYATIRVWVLHWYCSIYYRAVVSVFYYWGFGRFAPDVMHGADFESQR